MRLVATAATQDHATPNRTYTRPGRYDHTPICTRPNLANVTDDRIPDMRNVPSAKILPFATLLSSKAPKIASNKANITTPPPSRPVQVVQPGYVLSCPVLSQLVTISLTWSVPFVAKQKNGQPLQPYVDRVLVGRFCAHVPDRDTMGISLPAGLVSVWVRVVLVLPH